MKPLRAVLLAASALFAGALSASAQELPRGRAAEWLRSWSPLAPVADLSRSLAFAPGSPDWLILPPPRLGLLWTAGNPGAVGTDVDTATSQFRVGYGTERGEYRRPLDAPYYNAAELLANSQRPLGASGAAVGQVLFIRRHDEPGSHANLMDPYPSSPIVTTDSTTPGFSESRVRLEGVIGRRLGRFGLGIAPGYEVRDARTDNPRLARLGREATAGGTTGITAALPWLDLSVGLSARYVRGRETLRVFPISVLNVIYPLYGYTEPDTLNLGIQSYFREAIRRGTTVGFEVAGNSFGTAWIVYGRKERLREQQTSQQQEDPDLDTWQSEGWTWGAAAQRWVPGYPVFATAFARTTRLTGAATRSDLTGIIIDSRESALEVGLDLRVMPELLPWTGAVVMMTRRESRQRDDYLAELRSDITQWTPGITVELNRSFGALTAVSAAGSYGGYYASAAIPTTANRGPLYREMIGPELSLYAGPASAQAGTLTVLRRLPRGTALWLRLRYDKLSPGTSQSTIPLLPAGDRTRWSVIFGSSLPG